MMSAAADDGEVGVVASEEVGAKLSSRETDVQASKGKEASEG